MACDYCDDPRCGWNIQEENVTEVEKGSKVRVSFEGEYSHRASTTGRPVLHVRTGGPFPSEFSVPKDAKIEVLEKPVPPEPEQGSVIEFPDGAVYARTDANKLTESWWARLSSYPGTAPFWRNWDQLVKEHGNKFTKLEKPKVDLSGVKPYQVPWGWDEKGEASTAVEYKSLCYSSAPDRTLKVFHPGGSSSQHIRFTHGGHTFCLTRTMAVDIAKRILKTFE